MNEESEKPAKSRLVVDEDWKSRVEAEKESAKGAAAGGPTTGTATGAASTADSAAPDDTSATVQGEAPTQSKSQSEAAAQSKPRSAARKTKKASPQLPPASFCLLITSLANQAMALLGEAESPSKDPQNPEGDTEAHSDSALELARHAIDTLHMLEEKTRGNLVREESAVLTTTLHELRMTYVAIRDRNRSTAPKT
jgi:hypothetical protein